MKTLNFTCGVENHSGKLRSVRVESKIAIFVAGKKGGGIQCHAIKRSVDVRPASSPAVEWYFISYFTSSIYISRTICM